MPDLMDLEAELANAVKLAGPLFLERQRDGAWFRHFFDDRLSRPFTFYQKDFWNWLIEFEPNKRRRPRVECHPRGVGKSTHARGAAVYLLARQIKKYVLCISATELQAKKHFQAIKSMLESEKLLQAYPHLMPRHQKYRPSQTSSWSSDRLVTRTGQVVEFISLLGNARGFTTEEGARPDLMIPDDIDDSDDTPYMVAKKLDILSNSIIPAKGDYTDFIFPQNLIHRDSICAQVQDQRADILTDRIFVGPYPLLTEFEAERVELGDGTGAVEWKIIKGEPFDPAITVEYCERLLNDAGLKAFERECQQEVRKPAATADFREWSEEHHVITYSDFRKFFEDRGQPVWDERRDKPVIPPRWNVGMGLDWGTTVPHPSVAALVARPNATAPLPESYFVFAEVVMPQYPLPAGVEAEVVSPGRVARAIKEALQEWGVAENQVKQHLMSHEASAALNTFLIDLDPELKLFFNKWKAQRGSGVPQIQQALEIDRTQGHPFREGVNGKPRLYFVVPDDQGRLVEINGRQYVASAYNQEGFARARYEMPLYSHKNTGQKKIDDDFVDALRGLANIFFVKGEPATKEEKFEKKMQDKGLDKAELIAAEDLQGLQRRILEETAFLKKIKKNRQVGGRYGAPTIRRRS